MARLNLKYEGTIIKSEDSSIVPEDEWVLFRASDKFLLKVLDFYEGQCQSSGCSKEHLDDIQGLKDRVDEWQRRYPTRVKIPD